MKIRTIKTTFLFAFFLMLTGVITAQVITDADREAEVYAVNILEEEGVMHKGYNIQTKINKAIGVLDERKEAATISEIDYQKGLNILIVSRDGMKERAKEARLAQMDNKPGQPGQIRKAKGEGIYNLQVKRLKRKLDEGKLSQTQYDIKMEKLNERHGKTVK